MDVFSSAFLAMGIHWVRVGLVLYIYTNWGFYDICIFNK